MIRSGRIRSRVLRIEYPVAPGAVRRLRLRIFGLIVATWPALFGSLLSAGKLGSQFGLMLVATSLLPAAVIILLVPPMTLMSRAVVLGPDGVRVEAFLGASQVPWRTVRRIRVVTRRRGDLHTVSFLLAARWTTVPIGIDVAQAPEAAERVASAITHYAPGVHPSGDLSEVRWYSGGPWDGTYVIQEPMESRDGSIFWLAAAMVAASLDVPVVLSRELFPDRAYRIFAAAAYAVLAAVFFQAARQNAARIPAPVDLARANRWRAWVLALGVGTFAATVLILGLVLL